MRVSIGDVRLYFEVLGTERALSAGRMERRPTVIGLHGGPGLDGTKLRHELAPLAEVAQVVVPDQRGHGMSDRGPAAAWNLKTWAADVEQLSNALDIEHPVVLGVSFGGFVAQRFAATYPARAAGLIVVSSGPRLPSIEELVARLREAAGEEAAEVALRDWESPSDQTDAEWERAIGPLMSRRREPDEVIRLLEAARIRTMDVNHHWMQEAKAMDLRECLGAIRCPTLVILGEHDPLVPAHLGQEIVDAVPGGLARLGLLSGASHAVLTDDPTGSHRLIRDFLAVLEPA